MQMMQPHGACTERILRFQDTCLLMPLTSTQRRETGYEVYPYWHMKESATVVQVSMFWSLYGV